MMNIVCVSCEMKYSISLVAELRIGRVLSEVAGYIPPPAPEIDSHPANEVTGAAKAILRRAVHWAIVGGGALLFITLVVFVFNTHLDLNAVISSHDMDLDTMFFTALGAIAVSMSGIITLLRKQ